MPRKQKLEHRVNVMIDNESHDRLELLQQKYGTSKATLARIAIRDYLDRNYPAEIQQPA